MDECVIEWFRGEKTASVALPRNTRLANKIRKLAQKSSSVQVIADENEALFAHIPVDWVKISPKRQITEEQRQAAAERLRKAREG